MSQSTMTVWDDAKGVDPMKAERDRFTAMKWEHFGRGLGLQTEKIRKRALFPNWAWDDYSI